MREAQPTTLRKVTHMNPQYEHIKRGITTETDLNNKVAHYESVCNYFKARVAYWATRTAKAKATLQEALKNATTIAVETLAKARHTYETFLKNLQEVETKVEEYQEILKNLYQQYTKYTTPCTVN